MELSGGVDSANVALSLAARPEGHLVGPGAMILDGQRATQQVSRRRNLIRACGFTTPDITIHATAWPPLHPDGQRARTGGPEQRRDGPAHRAGGVRGRLRTDVGGIRRAARPQPRRRRTE